MPRINGINFYQNRSKIKLFLPKKSFFLSAGGSDPHTLRNPKSNCSNELTKNKSKQLTLPKVQFIPQFLSFVWMSLVQ